MCITAADFTSSQDLIHQSPPSSYPMTPLSTYSPPLACQVLPEHFLPVPAHIAPCIGARGMAQVFPPAPFIFCTLAMCFMVCTRQGEEHQLIDYGCKLEEMFQPFQRLLWNESVHCCPPSIQDISLRLANCCWSHTEFFSHNSHN